MRTTLTFHIHDTAGNNTRMSPSGCYIDTEYEKVAVRLFAEKAPVSDAHFDIFDDGVSIFNNKTPTEYDVSSGVNETGAVVTYITLPKGETSDEIAEDFTDGTIEEGSWISCDLITAGGAKNLTVELVLETPFTRENETFESDSDLR